MKLKKFATALTLLAFGGILTSFTQAQIIPLTIDSTQSSVEISINGNSSDSDLSGDVSIDVQSFGPPSGSAQITDLNLVVDDSISFSFFLGIVSVSSSPGDISISMVTPGPAGTLSGGSFDQLANSLELGGELSVSDPLNLAGGNQTFDLSEINLGPVDINAVNVSQTGNVLTISGSISINEMVDIGAGDVPLVVELDYVATGTVPDPVLLGDVNLDNVVNFLDIAPFIALLSSDGFQDEADIDINGVVNFLDIGPFIGILSGQ